MSRKISTGTTKTTTARETIYTVPTKNTALWNLLYVASLDGTNSPKVYWYDSSTDSEIFVFGGKNLGTGDYLMLSQAEVVLQEGDRIDIEQTGTSTVTYIMTLELIPNQATQFHGG